VASGKMVKESPNTLKAVLRALRKAIDTINTDRETAVKIVAREMKTEEELTRDIMALNVYSMELNDSVIYAKLLEEAEPSLVKWKSKTEVK
jgi:ABC-type nitrate/sulfonate/bicarbonate transport system substrate-binding protein